MGTSSGTRSASCSARMASGSRRSAAGAHSPWRARGTVAAAPPSRPPSSRRRCCTPPPPSPAVVACPGDGRHGPAQPGRRTPLAAAAHGGAGPAAVAPVPLALLAASMPPVLPASRGAGPSTHDAGGGPDGIGPNVPSGPPLPVGRRLGQSFLRADVAGDLVAAQERRHPDGAGGRSRRRAELPARRGQGRQATGRRQALRPHPPGQQLPRHAISLRMRRCREQPYLAAA